MTPVTPPPSQPATLMTPVPSATLPSMSDRLSRGSSGLKHLRWSREIYATLAAHAESSDLGDSQRSTVNKELARIDTRIQSLSAAVKGYRDFLERERVRYRGAIRAALHAADEAIRAAIERRPEAAAALPPETGSKDLAASGREKAACLRTLARVLTAAGDDTQRLTSALARLEATLRLMASECAPRRRALKGALEIAIAGLREGLLDMDGRLAPILSEEFVASLYPALAAGGTAVADDGDSDDDASTRA